ncbi:phage tail tape measure protein [Basfia succiniciproducens]|uniref:phage tail tape measure protein n=1 Tax=Basfia succiniciproducens TaxID=653940 RepID=UPI003FCE47EC
MNNLQLSVLLSAMDKMSAPMQNASKSVNSLSDALNKNKRLRSQLAREGKQNSASIEKYRNTINPLKNRLSELRAEQSKAEATANRLSKRIKELNNPSDAYRARVEKTQASVKKLKAEEIAVTQKLQQARAELAKNGISAGTLSQRQSELRNKLKGANTQINQQTKELQKLNTQQAEYNAYRAKVGKLKDISGRAQIFGAQTLAVGSAIATKTTGFLRPAADFEQDFSKVQALTNLSKANPEQAKQLEQLRSQAIHLGGTTSFSAGEVAQGQGYLAMAGFNAQQIEQAMPAVLSMTKAAGIEMGQASDIASDISSGFKIPAAEMNRVADVLTATFTGSNTTLEGLGETMKYLGPIATATGQDFETMSAMVGLLGNVGIKGSQAGTSLRAAMLRLAGPPKQAAQAMKKLGVSAKDSRGNMRPLTDVLVDVARKTDKMGSAQKMAYYKAIFGAEAATAMVELVGQAGVNGIQEMTDKLKQAENRAQQVADVMGDNVWGDLKNLSSASESLSITVFDSINDSLRGIVQGATELVRKVNEWTKAHPQLTAALVKFGIAISGSLTVLGALSLALSFLAYPIARIGLGLANLGKIFPNVSKSATVFYKTYSNWPNVGKRALTMINALGRGILKLLNPMTYIKGALNLVKNAFLGVGRAMLFLTTNPLGIVITAIAAGALLIYANWEKVKAFFGGFWDGLKSGLAPVLTAFEPLIGIFSKVVGWITDAVKWFMDLITPVKQSEEQLNSAASAGKKFGEWLAAGINIVTKPLQWLMDAIEWVLGKMPSVENSAENMGKLSQGSATTFANNTVDSARKIIKLEQHWKGGLVKGYASGGYTGNGGKYEPKGIVHGGEYVMTKAATSRLGTPLLNALNYGKNAMLATGLGMSVAMAQPIQVDSRPPLRAQSQTLQVSQPIQVTINVNATAGQDANAIAREVARQIAQIQQQAQVRARNSLRDRD